MDAKHSGASHALKVWQTMHVHTLDLVRGEFKVSQASQKGGQAKASGVGNGSSSSSSGAPAVVPGGDAGDAGEKHPTSLAQWHNDVQDQEAEVHRRTDKSF